MSRSGCGKLAPSTSDLTDLVDALHELYAPRPLHQLKHDALQLILRLIPADCAFYNENDIPNRKATWFLDRPDPDLPQRVPILERNMHQHPLFNHYLRTGDGRPRRISDFLSRDAFHRTDLYNEFYRPQHIEYQLDMWLPHPTRQVAVGLDRSDHDFSERDRVVLDLFRKHLIRAIEIAALTDRVRSAGPLCPESSDALRKLGLTCREAEVLWWVVQGKRNWEIGLILDCSPRTVQKHLERIFQKLGVETRTTATVRVMEMLGAPTMPC